MHVDQSSSAGALDGGGADPSGSREGCTVTFPVLWQGPPKELERLGCPREVPLELVAPHEEQACRNHGQSLKRLAERGGLGPKELLAVLHDREWPWVRGIGLASTVRALNAILAKRRLAAWQRSGR